MHGIVTHYDKKQRCGNIYSNGENYFFQNHEVPDGTEVDFNFDANFGNDGQAIITDSKRAYLLKKLRSG